MTSTTRIRGEGVDVLYLSPDEQRAAERIDLGDGFVPHCDEVRSEVVGLTVDCRRERLRRGLNEPAASGHDPMRSGR